MRTSVRERERAAAGSESDDRAAVFVADDRALAPVVGKTMEIAIVVLFVGVVTSGLYAGVVPEYRDTAGDRIADRTLASAGDGVEAAVPATEVDDDSVQRVHRRLRVDLPETIRGTGYWIHTDGHALVLEHPRERIGGRLRLNLPVRVVSVSGRWSSYEPAIVVVEESSDGLAVRLVRG